MEKCEQYLLDIKNNTEATKNNTKVIADILKLLANTFLGTEYVII